MFTRFQNQSINFLFAQKKQNILARERNVSPKKTDIFELLNFNGNLHEMLKKISCIIYFKQIFN